MHFVVMCCYTATSHLTSVVVRKANCPKTLYLASIGKCVSVTTCIICKAILHLLDVCCNITVLNALTMLYRILSFYHPI